MANIFFGRGKKKTLVVESSDMGLRAIGLNVTDQSIEVSKAFFSPWSLFLSQSQDEFYTKLSTVIKSLVSYCPQKEFSVVYCCSDSSNWNHWVQTANMEEEELDEYLLSKKIIRDPEVWISDTNILGNSVSEEKQGLDVMVQMVKSEIAQLVMDSLEEAGYELEAIEFVPNSLISFYEYYCEEGRSNHDVILSIGWENSMISIFHNAQLRFSYFLNFRLRDFVVLLMQKMQLDEVSAKTIVREELFDVILSGKPNTSEIMPEVLEEVGIELKFVIDELNRVFAFYVTNVMEWKIEGVERIIFSGTEVKIKSLQDYFSGQLALPISTLEPMANVEFTDEAHARIQKNKSTEFLWNTFGLALRHIGA